MTLAHHDRSPVIKLTRCKTNQQRGDTSELVVLPRATNPTRCPVATLTVWLQLAGITDGSVLRAFCKGNRAVDRRLTQPRSTTSSTPPSLPPVSR